MADLDGDVAELALWDGSSWKLKGWDAIGRWANQIEQMWQPIAEGNVGADPVSARNNVIAHWRQIKNRLEEARSAKISPRDFAPDLTNLMNQAWGPCHPDSPVGQVVNDLAYEHTYESAMFAYAIFRGVSVPGHAQNAEHARGMIAALSPAGTMRDRDHLSNERKNYRLGLRQLSDAVNDAEANREARWKALIEESTTGMLGWARRRSRVWHDTKSRWSHERGLLTEQLETLEATYREKLSLLAPVQYWENKADRHKISEAAAAGRVRLFFGLAIPFVVVMFGFTGWYLITQITGTPPAGLYIVVSAGLATTAGLLLWIGRLLTKLYLSQHHLRQDAEERAVMTTTYLALTAEQAASDADRNIILNALFRPTSDGIVKEDGGVDPNLASLISRIGVR